MKATARPRKTSPAISDPQSVLRLVIPNLHVPDVRLGTYVDSRQIGPFLRGTENLFVMYAVPGKILPRSDDPAQRSEEHTSELQSRGHLVCRLLLEKKKITVGGTKTLR